jgi:hypothetical protein
VTAVDPSFSVANIRHLIGDQWKDAADGEKFESRDPHDGTLLATVARGTAHDGAAAITAARNAFDDGPWPRMARRIPVNVATPKAMRRLRWEHSGRPDTAGWSWRSRSGSFG